MAEYGSVEVPAAASEPALPERTDRKKCPSALVYGTLLSLALAGVVALTGAPGAAARFASSSKPTTAAAALHEADANAPTTDRLHSAVASAEAVVNGSAASAISIDVPMSAFLAFPAVIDWLLKQGVDNATITAALEDVNDASKSAATDAATGSLLAYLPARLTIDYDAAAVGGSVGKEASAGFVTFSLFYGNAAAWNVVMDVKGRLYQVAPTRSVDAVDMAHFCALKNYDEETILTATTVNYTGAGAPFLWNWKEDKYERLGSHNTIVGAHDIQWAYGHDKHSFWAPGPTVAEGCVTNQNLTRINATTGAIMQNLKIPGGACDSDVNHAQLIDEDNTAFLSLRLWDALAMFDLDPELETGGTLRWLVGGDRGTWPIVDLNGEKVFPAGTKVWEGQHNAEYIGENEVIMYDNLGLGNVSRCLIVSVNESAEVATLVWEHQMDALSMIFGDCDPLPSGNILGSYWAMEYGNATPTGQAQSGVVEVVRGTKEVAWHMRIYGASCPDAVCHDSDHPGWKMYSIERFYESPLIAAAKAGAAGDDGPRCSDDGKTLSFTAWNTFKQSNHYPGSYVLTEVASGRVVASESFKFLPHWRPTSVQQREMDVNAGTEVDLVVTNERSRRVSYRFTCGKSSAGTA